MAVSDDQIAYLYELFEGLGGLSHKKMFGGLSLYHDGTIFAIMMSDGGVFLKAQGAFQDFARAEGWDEWTYERKDGSKTRMPYFHLPDAAMDDPEEATALARKALVEL